MTRAERVLLVLVLASILVSPVFLGGVGRFQRDWTGVAPSALEKFLWAEGPYALLSLLAVATAAAAAVVALERRAAGEEAPWRRHRALLLPLAGLAALALLQSVPLPRGVLALLSPAEARALDDLLPGDASWRPLTLSPSATSAFLGGLALGGATLLGTLLLARRRPAAVAVLVAVVAAYAGAAAYGMASTWFGGDLVLVFPKRGQVGVTGPFLNRNHMAAGAGLALPVAVVLAVAALRARRPGAAAAAAVAAAILAAAVPLARSRMGLAAGAAGLVALGVLAAGAVRWPAWGKAMLAILALAVAGIGVQAGLARVPELRRRFEVQAASRGYLDVRIPAWASAARLAARYPAAGTGLGTFEVAIHETQTADNPDELIHAHSEPLEALADGGLPGFLLAMLLAAGAVAGCVRATRHDDPLVRAAACACGAGLVALLAVGLTEFPLHIPALGIAAAAVAAVPAAMAAGPPGEVPGSVGGRGALVAAGILAVALAAASLAAGCRAADLRGEAVRAEQARDAAGWLASAKAAATRAPSDAAVLRSLSGALLEPWDGTGFHDRAERSLAAADRAVDLEPFHPYGHWSRARALLALGRFPDAAVAIRRSLSRGGGIGHLHMAAGSVLLHLSARDRSLRPAALAALREAGACAPRHWSDAARLLAEAEVPPEEVAAAVPDRLYALLPWSASRAAAGDFAGAFDAAARAWRIDPSPRVERVLLAAAARAGREAEAQALLAAPR